MGDTTQEVVKFLYAWRRDFGWNSPSSHRPHMESRFYTPGGVTSVGTGYDTGTAGGVVKFLYAWRRDFGWNPTPQSDAVTSHDDVRLHTPLLGRAAACEMNDAN